MQNEDITKHWAINQSHLVWAVSQILVCVHDVQCPESIDTFQVGNLRRAFSASETPPLMEGIYMLLKSDNKE